MIETIITSSALILVIAPLRYLLRGKISSRLQYALWLLVAVRLLLPFSLFESPVSVMNAIPNIQGYSAIAQPDVHANPGDTMLPSEASPVLQSSPTVSDDSAGPMNTVDGRATARFVWLCGVILSGVFFAISNIRFRRKLKLNRKQIETPQCPLTIYMANDLPSPCLYGMVRPVIYVTPESLYDEKRTEYVLAHELTHYRHKDHIWPFIRVLCLCIHWFNPLVWLAAVLSRRDSELACDEGTLCSIGPENRVEYGRTLIEMMTSPSKSSEIFCCATTMTSGNKEMAERIKRIVKQPKMLMITMAVVMAVAVAAVALTFGGAVRKTPIALPQSTEVIRIRIEQIDKGESLGAVQISQENDIELVLNALADTEKTLRKSVDDLPNRKDYFQIDIDDPSARRFYLYNDGEKYYLEEPYVGIFRTNSETSTAIDKIYTAKGDANLSFTVQALWKAQTLHVGDNSAVSELLSLLPLPSGLLHDHFALRTTGTERGIDWILKVENNSSFSVQQLEQNALLLFALIDNLENFNVTIANPPDASTVLHYTRSWANEFVGGDVRNYAKSLEKVRELIGFSMAESPSYSMVGPWPENQYTEGIPRPDFGTMMWMTPDYEKGYYAVCYQDVSRGHMESYLQTLANDGWQTIHDFYEDTTVGGLYEKGDHAISVQFSGDKLVMYFSLK